MLEPTVPLQPDDVITIARHFRLQWEEVQQAHVLLYPEDAQNPLAPHLTDMGHLPQSGEGGMMSLLTPLQRPRKVLIHINNTNPIIDEESPERAALEAAGIEVAYDGMDITL